ncbi:Arginine N-methyltransferase 2 [Fasciola hepatica]|uniref:Arginine N-methyltransferase 2 n=1 Tax=Fasciola hepatica TaxID=6192 RepID=A0A4E0RBH7_FASHE|nr:Arginine N-methyltransferase 2 [Fasciola hepatica]
MDISGECPETPLRVDLDLVLACGDGNLDKVHHLIEIEGADPCYQDLETGISVLMVAASSGHVDIVRYLLEEGAPWNAVDRKYMCAGDYAAQHGQQACIDALLDHAVMSELLLSLTLSKKNTDEDPDDHTIFMSRNPDKKAGPLAMNALYLASRLEFTPDGQRLVDKSTELAVMMDWEQPLMAKHAAWICYADQTNRPSSLRVLNVGFGMGIVDSEIQKHDPMSHVIIEAHPDVIKKMEEDGWSKKNSVSILRGRWQDVIPKLTAEIQTGALSPFDGIFFDTYAEDDLDLREFHSWLPKLLRPAQVGSRSQGGRYSYYNGVCPDNVFFHGVACETIRLHLKRLGIDCTFEPFPVQVSDPELWNNLSQRYWYFDTYFLPKCIFGTFENM